MLEKLFIVLIFLFTINQIAFCFKTTKRGKNAEISCKDENGNFVDWFYAYKLPGVMSRRRIYKYNGKFVFITSNSNGTTWTKSSKMIEDKLNLIGLTIEQAYTTDKARLVLAYNDEEPNGKTDSSHGHAKGLIVATSKEGFWLIHSVPKFPNITDEPSDYFFPKSALIYGQTFLCISVNGSEINKIAKQLIFTEPNIYSYKVSSILNDTFPEISNVINKKRIDKPPFDSKSIIRSTQGILFTSFSKSPRWQADLYEDLVAPKLDAGLYVETWRHDSPANRLPSNCTRRNSVWNISDIKIESMNSTFPYTRDHSKWAVGDKSDWICVGDINRSLTQFRRGGGTVCQNSMIISNVFRNSIVGFAPCEKPKTKKKLPRF